MSKAKIFRYESEAAMCAAFIKVAEAEGWVAYPETCGFDIVLVDPDSGVQIGVEAKQQLNPHVVLQASQAIVYGHRSGPDYRCVLVPEGGTIGVAALAKRMGITVIRALGEPEEKDGKPRNFFWRDAEGGGRVGGNAFEPNLPSRDGKRSSWLDERDWQDCCPVERLSLPDYVPQVVAGASAPLRLTKWKIKAIKLVVLLEKRGHVTPSDFKDLKIHPSLWSQNGWLAKGEVRGKWVAGRVPDFRKEHPQTVAEIEADFDKWGAELLEKNRVYELALDGGAKP